MNTNTHKHKHTHTCVHSHTHTNLVLTLAVCWLGKRARSLWPELPGRAGQTEFPGITHCIANHAHNRRSHMCPNGTPHTEPYSGETHTHCGCVSSVWRELLCVCVCVCVCICVWRC